jgi:hypothetical protein
MENLWEENCSKIDSVADSVEQGVQLSLDSVISTNQLCLLWWLSVVLYWLNRS